MFILKVLLLSGAIKLITTINNDLSIIYALRVYENGTTKFHCLGSFITYRAILTSASCVGKFSKKVFIRYESNSIILRDIELKEYTKLMAVIPSGIKQMDPERDLLKSDFGCWIVKEQGKTFHNLLTKSGENPDYHALIPHFINQKAEDFVLLKLEASSTACVQEGIESVKKYVDSNDVSCLTFAHSSSAAPAAIGTPVFSNNQIAGVVSYGFKEALVMSYINFSKEFLEDVKKLSQITLSQYDHELTSTTSSFIAPNLFMLLLFVLIKNIVL